MSIKVELDAINDEMAVRPIGYLLTAGEDGAPHASDAAFSWDGDCLVAGAGRTIVRHVAGRPKVCCLWPPAESGGYTLIVDGDAEITGEGDSARVRISPTWAVLHRRATEQSADPDADCKDDCQPLIES